MANNKKLQKKEELMALLDKCELLYNEIFEEILEDMDDSINVVDFEDIKFDIDCDYNRYYDEND